jgi:ankyrin repeat protein
VADGSLLVAVATQLLPCTALPALAWSDVCGHVVRMAKMVERPERPRDDELLALFQAIAMGDDVEIARRLHSSPELATCPIVVAASRVDATAYFLAAIGHYVYSGDTALHVAAAAHRRVLVESLVTRGADIRARNRRGAEPLHYAADGSPAEQRDGAAQRDVITYLVGVCADPNAMDNSGVAPLHRAVRNRCSAAVRALIDWGADPLLKNTNGSTPLHLAVQNTGKSNSGSDEAKEEQRRIIAVLLEHGARATDTDTKGKSVAAAATSVWIRELLGEC